MENVVTALQTSISGDAMWNAFGTVVPLIASVTVFALGFYFIRKAIKKAAKAKPGV